MVKEDDSIMYKPTIYDPENRAVELYSGVPSFLGMPVIHNKDLLKNFDFAVLGIPWEGGCTFGGCSTCIMAPKIIREVSLRYTGYLPEYDIDLFDHLTCCDYGDVPVQNGNYDFTFQSIRSMYADIINENTVPIVFGGDHSISYPLISELAQKYPRRLGIIHFDAHLDNYPSFGNDPYSRCSPFNRLYQDINIDPTKIVHIGIRGPRNHPQERREACKYGASIITAKEIKEQGYYSSIKKALKIAQEQTDAIYVTVCSDVLDGAANPQGPIDPCGLSSFEICMMLNECGYAGARSFDFVEIYPESQGAHISAHTANYFAIYFMNGVARGRLEKQK